MVGFAVVLLAMGIRVVFGRRPLRGSCGGVAGQCDCGDAGVDECHHQSSAARGAPGDAL